MVDISGISALLKSGVDCGDVPGVVAAAATRDGPIFEGAFGKRDLASKAAMTVDTVVRIASMTKAVAGACAMQLVEQGKLALESPIDAILPELENPHVLEGFDSNGEPKLRKAARPITLRHLLTHTSGLAYGALHADLARYLQRAGIPNPETRLNASLRIPLLFDPGDCWHYGIGIDWAGKAVEAVSGMTLGQYMQENIFDPLEMTDTSFQPSEAQAKRLAKIYLRSAEGLKPIERDPPLNAEFQSGGGGLYSTVSDYLRFAQMILHNGKFNGEQILKPKTVAMMAQNAIGETTVRPLRAAVPEGTNPVEFIDGMKWGLTFLINPEPMPTGRSAGSLAWSGVMNSYYWIDRTAGVTGVYATQILPFFDAKAVKLYDDFEAAVYQAIEI